MGLIQYYQITCQPVNQAITIFIVVPMVFCNLVSIKCIIVLVPLTGSKQVAGSIQLTDSIPLTCRIQWPDSLQVTGSIQFAGSIQLTGCIQFAGSMYTGTDSIQLTGMSFRSS